MTFNPIPKPSAIPLVEAGKTQRENIVAGAHYLLPLEVESLHAKFDTLVGRHNGLSVLWNEAMTQSSETFHDNAPAEVVGHAANIISTEADAIIRVMRAATQVDYPETNEFVGIGNVVTIAYDGEDDRENMLLTGYTGKVDVTTAGLDPETAAVSAASPLGLALLEARVGDAVSYEVKSRPFRVGVLAIGCIARHGELVVTE